MDRLTIGTTSAIKANESAEYLENNCLEDPSKMCEFKKLPGKILKTVDSVLQDVMTVEECRQHCLESPFRCRSYDYGDTGLFLNNLLIMTVTVDGLEVQNS